MKEVIHYVRSYQNRWQAVQRQSWRLAVGEEGSVKVGAPVVEGASVVAKVVKTGKGKKLNILTYRPKKGSMVRKGHRQPYTKVEITAING